MRRAAKYFLLILTTMAVAAPAQAAPAVVDEGRFCFALLQSCIETDDPAPVVGVEEGAEADATGTAHTMSKGMLFDGDTGPTDALWWRWEDSVTDTTPPMSRTICSDADAKWHRVGNQDGYYTDYKSGWYNYYTNTYGDNYYYYMQSRSVFLYRQGRCIKSTNKYQYRNQFRTERRYRGCIAPQTGCVTRAWEYVKYTTPKCYVVAPNKVAVYCLNRYGRAT